VALLLERNKALIVALLGLLKAGKCYVPLDPAFPLARLHFMLDHAQASILVTNSTALTRDHTVAPAACQVLNLDQLDGDLAAENPQLTIAPDSLCSILYTSGSTGRPKGVMRTHRQQLRDTRVYTDTMHLSAHDRMALLTFGTGQAMQTLFSALLNGAALYPYNVNTAGVAHVANWLLQEQITVYTSGTPLFRHVLDTLTDATTLPHLWLIRLGSEAVSRRDVARFQRHFSPDCLLLNALSTTETGPICCYFIDKAMSLTDPIIPVGYPMKDVAVFVLDDTGTDVGVGQVGEIVVKGTHFAPGYWRQPELTATVFHPDPHTSGACVYNTGDLGRRCPDGSLEHHGRKGGRVKIRGYSVEVAEVEVALQALDQVHAAAVMVRDDRPEDQRLVAYVVPAGQPAPT
jgi:amino acid adenylation domain-containing protein